MSTCGRSGHGGPWPCDPCASMHLSGRDPTWPHHVSLTERLTHMRDRSRPGNQERMRVHATLLRSPAGDLVHSRLMGVVARPPTALPSARSRPSHGAHTARTAPRTHTAESHVLGPASSRPIRGPWSRLEPPPAAAMFGARLAGYTLQHVKPWPHATAPRCSTSSRGPTLQHVEPCPHAQRGPLAAARNCCSASSRRSMSLMSSDASYDGEGGVSPASRTPSANLANS